MEEFVTTHNKHDAIRLSSFYTQNQKFVLHLTIVQHTLSDAELQQACHIVDDFFDVARTEKCKFYMVFEIEPSIVPVNAMHAVLARFQKNADAIKKYLEATAIIVPGPVLQQLLELAFYVYQPLRPYTILVANKQVWSHVDAFIG